MTKIIHVPIENHILDTYDFRCFADYFRKSYEEFMGVSTNEVKYSIYTLEEQIDRYAKNISFWFIQLEKVKKTYGKNKITKIRFIKSQLSRLINATEQIFPQNVPSLIQDKALNMVALYS